MKVKKSTIVLLIILIAYTILSFYKLGRNENPQTYFNLKNGRQLIYEFEQGTDLKEVMLYTGNNVLYITFFLSEDYTDVNKYSTAISYNSEYVFRWNKFDINVSEGNYKYLVLQSYYDTTTLGEIKAYDSVGNEIALTPVGENEKLLLDEQSTVPDEFSYENSSYFDEVYFPRASYEIMNKLPIFEYSHPVLGKLIMSIPMYFCGVTPFAYRLMGNIAGIFMIFIIYLIAKELFKKEIYGILAAVIMATDGMHFVQTRIGTVDTFLVLFILISFLFFIKYIKLKKEDPLKKKVIALILSGTFWGMAISVKWTAAFAGLGMGIIYAIDFFKNKKWDIKLILFSVLAFVIIPICIYVISYIPVILDPSEGIVDIESFIEYQKNMYKYHSELVAEHPFSSPWYTWPIIQKPLWYYSANFENGKYATIACMGNPAIWWLSILTAGITLIYSIFKKNREGMMLITMILSSWLAYHFIGRIMFIYHYFITIPFMMLTIVFVVSKLVDWKEKLKYFIPVLCAIFLGFFIYFYPIYSGMPVDKEYIEKTKWMDSWIY